jgi:tRNA pseudouridine55 synthase
VFADRPVHTLESLEALAGREEVLDTLLLPADVALSHWPAVHLDALLESRFVHGQSVSVEAMTGAVRVYGATGRFLGLGECHSGIVVPKRLFN